MMDVIREGDVEVLRLDHGKSNALDIDLCEAITEALGRNAASSARGIVLTGHGRIFSAGVDLIRLLEGGAPYIREFLPAFARMLESLFSHSLPVVAALNGHTIAGGCVLACAADRRLMLAGGGRVGVPELRVGLPFPPFALEVMRFAVPARHLPELLYGGATFDPAEAKACGLLDGIVDPEALMDRAVQEALSLATPGAATFSLTKAQVRRAALEAARAGQRLFGAEVERIWTDPDTLSAVASYVERTLRRSAS